MGTKSSVDVVGSVAHAGQRLVSVYRRSGADVPFGDPLPSHGTEMEGWFWRLSDPAQGRVVVALCSENRHPDGNWSTAAIALHPGGIVRSAAIDGVRADRTRFSVQADSGGDLIDAGRDRLRMVLGDTPPGAADRRRIPAIASAAEPGADDRSRIEVDLTFRDSYEWPKAFGGGGVFSSVPFLNQYWHPYRLGGKASGTVTHADECWTFTDATLYCERNWGAGFPQRWWWGQAHDFGDADVSVAFSGGLLELGPLQRDVTGVVVRLGDRVLRITPPALVSSNCDVREWHIDARTPRYHVVLDGQGTPDGPHVLPVPLPAERRNIDTDYEYLAGTLRCTIREWGRTIFEGTTELAALEVGTRPA